MKMVIAVTLALGLAQVAQAHVVVKDDSLSKLAGSLCGLETPGQKYTEALNIAKVNGIKNPALIFPGQVIEIPCLHKETVVSDAKTVEVSIELLPTPTIEAFSRNQFMLEVDFKASLAMAAYSSSQDLHLKPPVFMPKTQAAGIVAKKVEVVEAPAPRAPVYYSVAVPPAPTVPLRSSYAAQVKQKKAYRVDDVVPQGKYRDMYAGLFPAVILRGQRESNWDEREDVSVTIKEVGTDYEISLVTKNKPGSTAYVAIDLLGEEQFVGYSFSLEGLPVTEVTVEELPKKLSKETYKGLHDLYSKRDGFFWRTIKTGTKLAVNHGPPIGYSVGMALVGNPFPAISTSSDYARNIIAKRRQKILNSAATLQSQASFEELDGRFEEVERSLQIAFVQQDQPEITVGGN